MDGQNTSIKKASRFREIAGVLRKHRVVSGLSPEKVRMILEDLGPTFIKLGQIMSVRPDILPKEYCVELMRLRESVSPMPFSHVIEVIENSYGRSVKEVFREIDEKPLGSASIAQVHSAVLLDGQRVVVKVQRKGVYETMSRDMKILKKVVRVLRYNGATESFNFNMILDEVWGAAQKEMNFLLEASNIEEFSRLNRDVAFVSYPKMYREFTTTQVLVMEYIDGIEIDDKEKLLAAGYDLEEIGSKLTDHYIKQIIEDGFFHADPHPGNIRIRDGKIVWFDMGQMGRLSRQDQQVLRDLVEGVAHHDINMVKDAVLCISDFRGRVQHHRLYSDLDTIMIKYGKADFGGMNLSRVLEDLIMAMRNNKAVLPRGLFMLAKGLTILEGIISDICPGLNMVEIASVRMYGSWFKNFDLKKELSQNGRKVYQSARKALEIPSLMADVLGLARKGQMNLHMDLHAADNLSTLLIGLVRKLIAGLLVAALLVGSSIVCTTNMQPQILDIPALGVVGFIVAIILLTYIFWDNRLLGEGIKKRKRR